jgi:arsenate reductase
MLWPIMFAAPSGPAAGAGQGADGKAHGRDFPGYSAVLLQFGRTMTVTIYGIKNCDTMKKARAWLDARGVEYIFHDYKSEGISKSKLDAWAKEVGWEVLLNRAGTTFRALSDKDKEGITEKKAVALMAAQPSMIKRPVLELGGKILVGFKPDVYEAAFGKRR